jgi:hypothetical protein
LVRVDEELQKAQRLEDVPSLLLMTGDQVYADDVAGPMLHAIQCVIHQLGLYQEVLEGASLSHSKELTSVANAYYHRDELLPESEFNEDLTGVVAGALAPCYQRGASRRSGRTGALSERTGRYRRVSQNPSAGSAGHG